MFFLVLVGRLVGSFEGSFGFVLLWFVFCGFYFLFLFDCYFLFVFVVVFFGFFWL